MIYLHNALNIIETADDQAMQGAIAMVVLMPCLLALPSHQ